MDQESEVEVKCPTCKRISSKGKVVGKTTKVNRGIRTNYCVVLCKCGEIYTKIRKE